MLLEDAVLSVLRPGSQERFVLPEASVPRVARALDGVLAANAVPEVARIIDLISALEHTLNSPSAAETLRGLLRARPAALTLIRRKILRRGGEDELRRFRAREGRSATALAPRHDGVKPKDSIALRPLARVVAMDMERRRAQGRARSVPPKRARRFEEEPK